MLGATIPVIPLAITFFIHSVAAASLWLLLRFDDSGIRQQVIGMLCYSLAFFGSISFFYQRYSNAQVLPIHIIVLILLPNILAFVPVFGFWVLAGLAFIGLVALVLALVNAKHKLSIWKYCFAIILGSFWGVWHFLFLQSVKESFVFSNVFSDLGIYRYYIHHDTTFHSAIIQMLQTFNIPSTGIDGVPPLFYHIGMHRWIASNLHYLPGEPVTLLAATRDILWVPVFLFSLSFSVLAYSESESWLGAALFATVGNFTYCMFVTYSHLISESHLLSLLIFISFMPIGLRWTQRYYLISPGDVRRSRSVLLGQVFCTSLGIIICWIVKMSTGLIMTCYLIGCLIVPRFLERPRHWFILGLSVILGIVMAILFLIKALFLPDYEFELFAFYRTFPKIATFHIQTFAVCLFITWLFFQGQDKVRNSVTLLMVSVFLIGQAPGLLSSLAGGSWYFSDLTIWLSYFLASSVILTKIQTIKSRIAIGFYLRLLSDVSETSSPRRRPDTSNLAEIVLNPKLFVVCLACWTISGLVLNLSMTLPYQFYINIMQPTNALVKQALSLENSPLSLDVPQEKKGSAWDKFARFKQRLVPGKIALMKHTELGRIQSIAKNLVTDKKATVIYVPPDAPFWEDAVYGITPAVVCWAKPFAIPALTGMPMLNGVRSGVGDCPVTQYYGMKAYADDSLNRKLDSKELCQRARKLGFKNVLEIKPQDYQIHICKGD